MSWLHYGAIAGLALLSLCKTAIADSFTEDFSSLTRRDTASTAVWNLVSQKLHLPLYVDAETGTESDNEVFSIGTGEDGVFNSSTYSAFDLNGGSIANQVLLSSDRIYNFTSFELDAGTTVLAQGTNALEIRVQGVVSISGTINISGGDGAAVSADTSTTASGGTACCAGGAGGNGGTSTSSNGATGSGSGGATGGVVDAAGGGGGGGAGHKTAGINGTAAAGGGAGGTGGAAYGNELVTTLLGGSGGGGGAAHTAGTTATNSTGGGGGGGGGLLKLTAGGNISIDSTGLVYANGGNGGSGTDAARLGGGGGAGSGGVAIFFSGGVYRNDGQVKAIGGTAGSGSGGGAGAAGRTGRTRLVSTANTPEGTGSENPAPVVIEYGEVKYSPNVSYTVLSKAFDTENSTPTYSSIDVTSTIPTNTTATVKVATSSDNFVNDSTEFVDISDLSTIQGRRYIKFQVTLFTSDKTVTPEVSKIIINYTPATQAQFNFQLGGCARSNNTTDPSPWSHLILLLSLLSLPYLGRLLPIFGE